MNNIPVLDNEHFRQMLALIITYHAIILGLCCRHTCIGAEDCVDNDLDRVSANINGPLPTVAINSVVYDTLAKVATCFKRIAAVVTCRGCTYAGAQWNRIRIVIDVRHMVSRWLQNGMWCEHSATNGKDITEKLTGEGRCRRRAAIFSPGDSNATTGAPNVTPTSAARPPPRLCPVMYSIRAVIYLDIPNGNRPVSQIVELGYM